MTVPEQADIDGPRCRPWPLAVTTAHRANADMTARARVIARRCSVPVLERQSRAKMRAQAELIYVVGKEEEFVWAPEGRLVAGEGLMKLKRIDGTEHPLIKAVSPREAPAKTVLDGTLGLGQDALHLSVVAGLAVDGVERSAPLVCLVEDFLRRARTRWGEAPARIRPMIWDAEVFLAGCRDDQYDVVYLDPMFDRAMPAQPDFRVLRSMAHEAPLAHETFTHAVRVARQRVVLKVRTLGEPAVEPPPPGWNRRVNGRAFNYWIVEKALANPELEPLRVKYSCQKLRFLGLLRD